VSHELHYTSLTHGLKPGSHGFCTVAATLRMPGALAERLEALSGFQPIFAPFDPSAALNPIVYSHLKLTYSGDDVSVLSRIGPAGLDYSGRPNKYAHHVILERAERPEGGPAWLLSQRDFMQSAWDGEPREILTGRVPPPGTLEPGMAQAWASLTGDGGWAGVLAETFLADATRPVFLVFRPGMDLLSLIVEATALVPPSRRWDVAFSTYFTGLPRGVTCAWRGVLEGSAVAKDALRLPNALVVNLCAALGRAEGGSLVQVARAGGTLVEPVEEMATPNGAGHHRAPIPREPVGARAAALGGGTWQRPSTAAKRDELPADLARLAPAVELPTVSEETGRSTLTIRWRAGLLAAVAAACLFALVAGWFRWGSGFDNRRRQTVVTARQIAGVPDKGTRPPGPLGARGITGAVPDTRATSADKSGKNGVVRAAGPPETKKRDEALRVGPTHHGPQPTGDLQAARVKEPNEPKPTVRFCDLAPPGSLLRPDQQASQTLIVQKGAKLARIIFSGHPDVKVTESADASVWNFETTSLSSIGPRVKLARIEADQAAPGTVRFRWSVVQGSEPKNVNAIRDAALKIQYPDRHFEYLLLRDPRIATAAVEAQKATDPGAGHPDKKVYAYPWARNPDALDRTAWNLGVREWRMTFRLAADRPERAFSDGPGHDGGLRKVIAHKINGSECRLLLALEPVTSIRVVVELGSGGVERDMDTMQSLLEQYDLTLKDLGITSNPRASPLGLERELEAFQLSGRFSLGGTVSKGDLDRLRELASHAITYNFMLNAQVSRFEAAIGLELDDGTILDIAHVDTLLKP
jgi:GTPase-associated protein 1, N-terminal domain type 2/GTPase-associated protein 1, middle domain